MADQVPKINVMKRRFHCSYIVQFLRDMTVDVAEGKVYVENMLAEKTLDQIGLAMLQEWYLQNMDTLPAPKDPNNPLDEYKIAITGLIEIECNDDGTELTFDE